MKRGLLLAAIVVAACARLPPLPLVSAGGQEVLGLLEFYERLADLPVEQQKIEYAAAQGAFDLERSDANRLRLALTLSLPQTPWRDEARVLALVAPVEQATREEAAPLRGIAMLLRKSAAEHLRLREDQRRRDVAWREEQRRNEELQKKLEALRTIDREMRRPPPRR